MITPCFLESKAEGRALRVGVLVDGPRVPRFVARILGDIARSNFARVDLVILLREEARSPLDLVRRLPTLAHTLYALVDRGLAGADDPLGLVEVDEALVGVERLVVPSPGDDGELRLSPSSLEAIARRELDVILCLGSAAPRGEILRAARRGVWSYRHGESEQPRGGTPFLGEIARGAATLDVELGALDDDAAKRVVLCRATFAAGGSMFVARQRHAPIWETTHFVLWKLHELHERGWEHVLSRAVPPRPPESGRAQRPSTGEMARFVLPRVATGLLRRLGPPIATVPHWRIALRRTSRPIFDAHGARDATDFRWIDAPRGHWFADPFLFERGGKTYLFCEDFDFERGFAGIGYTEVTDAGEIGPIRRCVDPGFHVSFPHVFEIDGDVFMIPESAADATVSLYRARRFPDVWTREKVLFRGNAADTVLWHEGGRFHFFTTLFDRDDRGMTTVLFVADSLTGAWRVHPASPISGDARRSRSAGAMFRSGGRLFRPVQNCGPWYGYSVIVEEVVRLDEERFESRPWCWIDPSSVAIRARGVHTYNRAGALEAIDSYTFVPPRR